MSPRETKELVGYLKKETKRLRDAIQKAEEKSHYGKAEHHRQSLDCYQKFLENVYSTFKKPLLFLAVIIFILAPFFSFVNRDEPALSGKNFSVELSENGKEKSAQIFHYKVAFVDGKLYSKPANKEKQPLPISGFAPGKYTTRADSAKAEVIIYFAATSEMDSKEILLWHGTVTNKKIQGTLYWFDISKGYKIYSFTGKLKYVNASEGEF